MHVARINHTHETQRIFCMPRNSLKKLSEVKIALILLPGFSFFSYQAIIEPLSLLNATSGKKAISWASYSVTGQSIESSDGSLVCVEGSLPDPDEIDMIILCGGYTSGDQLSPDLMAWLRKPQIRTKHIGAIESGTLVLMEAGLLNGYDCSVHWRFHASAKELFPHLKIQTAPYLLDRNRFTGAGGVAILDMMFDLIKKFGDETIAQRICAQFNRDQNRAGVEGQRIQRSFESVIGNDRLNRALEFIDDNLEGQLSCEDVADVSGMSRRQLERQFKQYLKVSPSEYVSQIRLLRAADLLTGTALSITEIAYACGFNSSTHFSKRFKEYFGIRPRDSRTLNAV